MSAQGYRKRPAREQMSSSFVDLMTSLMVIFVLLLVAKLTNQASARAVVAGYLETQLRRTMADGERAQIGRDSKDPNTVVISVPEQALSFDPMKASLKPEGIGYLSEHVSKWAKVLCSKEVRPNMDSIVVEGHSDGTHWQGSTYEQSKERNLALSQQRSMAVVSSSLSLLKESPEYRDCFLQTLSATGRGEEDLVDKQTVDSAKNRRVVFKLRLRPEAVDRVSAELEEAGNSTREQY